MHRHVVHTMAHFSIRVRNAFGVEPAVDRFPGLPGVVGPERASGGNSYEDAIALTRVENDGVQAQATRAGLPRRAGAMLAQSTQLVPGLSGIAGAKQRAIL